MPLGAIAGRKKIAGLGILPVAVQIRVERGGEWSRASTFKRIGGSFLGPEDTIISLPACVNEALPTRVYFGADNAPREGRQRVPDDTVDIVAGDVDGHFQILSVEGRKYLVPSGSGSWKGGEVYNIVLNDALSTSFAVEILADTAVLASPEWSIGAGSVAEIEAWFDRVGDRPTSLDGKTLLLRYGFYDFKSLSNNARKNWHGVDETSNGFKLGGANTDQKPMVQHFFVATPARGGTGRRRLFLEDCDFFSLEISEDPQRAGPGEYCCEIQDDDNSAASSFAASNCVFRTDLIEARYGVGVRGTGNFVRFRGLYLRGHRNVSVTRCTAMYLTYAYFLEGCEGTFSENFATHIHADYMNINPSATRACSMVIENNRFREHCGDQNEIHSDGWHVFWRGESGVFRNCVIRGNIWLTGFEGLVAPPGLTARVANNVVNFGGGDLMLGAEDFDHRYLILEQTGKITFPSVRSVNTDRAISARHKDGYATALNNLSDGDIVVVIPGQQNRTLKPGQRVLVFEQENAWQVDLPVSTFQGAPYQNNGNTVFENFIFRDNIILGISALSAALFAGTAGRPSPLPDNAEASSGLYVESNAWMSFLHDPVLDDFNEDGHVDNLDGLFAGDHNVRFTGGLRARSNGVWTDQPTGIVMGHNIIGTKSSYEVPVDQYNNLALGNVGSDTAANRGRYLADNNDHDWRPRNLDTFKKVIEAVRIKEKTDPATAHIGPVGPTDDAVGYYNWSSKSHNGYPKLTVERCFPEQNGLLPAGKVPFVEFNYPIREVDLTGITIQQVDGITVPTTPRIDGRRIYLIPDKALADATTYEILLPVNACRNALDSRDRTPSIDQGAFSFTNSARAFSNILAQQTGDFPPIDQNIWFDGTDQSLTTSTRFDTHRYGDASPFLGTGPAIFSVEIAKGTGANGIEILYVNGGTTREKLAINLETGNVAVPPRGVPGTHYGVADNGLYWKLWIRVDLSSVSRYYFEVNIAEKTSTWRRPMLIDADIPNAPFIAPSYEYLVRA